VDTGTGDAGGAGGAGGGGVTAAPEESGEDGGCACSTVGHKSWGGAFAAGLFAFGAIALVRRRRR